MTGCKSSPKEAQRRTVTAADFISNQPRQVEAEPAPQTPSTAPAQQESQPVASNETPVATPPVNNGELPSVLTMDAMVGQVNGRAIYANAVFEPIEAQLAALGRTLPPSIFKQRATDLIVGQLQTIVTNALILGEAERDLSRQEQYGLVSMLKARREELLRRMGEGSAVKADEYSLRTTGKSIDQQVDEYRQQVLVGRYIGNRVRPRINVTRKDIERYYDTHHARYNPAAQRTLRVIMTNDPANADHIDKMLASGKTFEEVARQPMNLHRSSNGGMWPSKVEGDKLFSAQKLNDAMVALKAGEHTQRIEADRRFWWIKLETFEQPKGRSLEEVQLEIRQILEDQQRDALGMEFRRKLLTEGSYNPIDQMTGKLVDIAMSRYSQPIPVQTQPANR
jgi:hypothetical protein